MSRSYRHTPYGGMPKDKFHKKYANRKIRQIPLDQLPLNHSSYKKNYERWLICDYRGVGIDFELFWSIWSNCYENKEKAYNDYVKYFLRK